MDLSDTPEQARFRAEIRAWLAEALPRLPWPEPADLVAKQPFWRQWQRMLHDAGYGGLSWPKEDCGARLDARARAGVHQEGHRAGAPERLDNIGQEFVW